MSLQTSVSQSLLSYLGSILIFSLNVPVLDNLFSLPELVTYLYFIPDASV